ncbi:efflux RND transporter periplasmic adaptor subunit [Hyphomicrobium sp. 99]|uniref:efflux RND transporter periplasmic adaptor subunit n=1 Tax=Hyphomicrobium sp. 99 TaxID=1163419 RepID=UPI0018CED856|nr:HlyD family efflux transporter periplasmic adaptor subunit [Hyphomicrobium sp. 99]
MKLAKSLAAKARLALGCCVFVAVFLTSPLAMAHGGEDHGSEGKTVDPGIAARVVASSELYEISGVPTATGGGKLVIYLTDFWSNQPVKGAKIDVTFGETPLLASAVKDHYELSAPWVTKPGSYALTFSVAAGDNSDLLIGTLDIPAAVTQHSHESIWDHILRHDLIADVSEKSSAAVLDLPDNSRRVADGSIFMPKATQALLGVETLRTSQAMPIPKIMSFAGQVVTDPNRSGVVQSLLNGRIEPPEGGFPIIGSRVQEGQVLGYLMPRVELVDQSDIRQTTGELDRQIKLAESKVARYDKLKNVIADSLIADAHLELDGLRARRAEIKPVLGARQPLTAPASGVIAVANVSAGQVVDPQTTLFQIVDRGSLFVEALAFDLAAVPGIEHGAKAASAVTSDGQKLTLEFVGRGLSLRQQAVPLLYHITSGGDALSLGQPVNVDVPVEEPVKAIPVPRSSVVRTPNGQQSVLVHVAPERFEARPVIAEQVDADRLGITAGVDPDVRIVGRGAELINQVR